MRYRTQFDGQWVKPRMKNYYMKCCDCGLVHRINFAVHKQGRGHIVQFQAFRVSKSKRRKVK